MDIFKNFRKSNSINLCGNGKHSILSNNINLTPNNNNQDKINKKIKNTDHQDK